MHKVDGRTDGHRSQICTPRAPVGAKNAKLLFGPRTLSQALAQNREQYKQVSGGVTERSRVLAQITDNIESIKSEMEERGSSMTDGSPLVNIRKSLSRVRQEILGMDVRIGVLEHTVMQARLRDR